MTERLTKYPYADHDIGIVLTQPESGKFERRPMTPGELAARDTALAIAQDIYRHANYAGACYYEIWLLIAKTVDAALAQSALGATTQLLTELDALEAKATKGDWTARFGSITCHSGRDYIASCSMCPHTDDAVNNAAFIAALRNAYPKLRALTLQSDPPAGMTFPDSPVVPVRDAQFDEPRIVGVLRARVPPSGYPLDARDITEIVAYIDTLLPAPPPDLTESKEGS